MRYPEACRLLCQAVLSLAILAAMASPASAHRLKVFASAIGDSIEGEAYFVGSGPAAGVAVTLRDGAGNVLTSGRTGADGRFALPASGAGDIVVTVDAQDGHIARFTVAGSEPTATSSSPRSSAAGPSTASQSPAATVPLADIELAVARRIAPLAAQVDALQSSLRLQDIIGGVGYIVGLFGLLAFVNSRRSGKGRAP